MNGSNWITGKVFFLQRNGKLYGKYVIKLNVLSSEWNISLFKWIMFL